MARVVLDPTLALDELRHSPCGPQTRGVSQRFRSTSKFLLNAPEIALLQQRLAPGARRFPQGPAPPLTELPRPAIYRLAMHTDLACNLRFAESFSQQCRSTEPPLLQSFKIPFNTGWVAHAGNISSIMRNVTILCDSQ